MSYNDKVIDHFENPRNVGSLDKNDPNVGSVLAEDAIKAAIKDYRNKQQEEQ